MWVEDYKNIKKQGFNFSPRFECKFHAEYEDYAIPSYWGERKLLKNNCKLDILDKKKGKYQNNNYIENFFTDNVNVTAIVGKNGSGKSTLLNHILVLASDSLSFILPKNFIFIFNEKEKLHILCSIDTDISNRFIEPIIHVKNKEYIVQQCPKLSFDYNNLKKEEDSSKIFRSFMNQLYSLHIVSYPSQVNIYKNFNFNFDCIDFFDKSREKEILIQYILDKGHKNHFGNYFEPNVVEIEYINKKMSIGNEKKFQKIFKDISNQISEQYDNNILIHFKFLLYRYLCQLIVANRPNLLPLENNYCNTYSDLEKYINNYSKTTKEEDVVYNFLKLLDKYKDNIEDIFQSIEIPSLNIERNIVIDKFLINIDFFNEDNLEFLLTLPPCFNINILNDQKQKYDDLSSGEKSALRIRFFIEDIIKKHSNKKEFLILLDEPSNDMHPDWQKKFLNYLINTFQNRKQKFHFIITTHSPFLLSDIPKQNIIFLDRYKEDDIEVKNKKRREGNCKVVDGLSQTFGANIHTLLSNSFFMDKGLMGEFAKNKINNVIKFLKDDESDIKDKDEAKKVIEMIGEPFLKHKLEQIYFEKYPKSNDELIKEYEDKIKELKNANTKNR